MIVIVRQNRPHGACPSSQEPTGMQPNDANNTANNTGTAIKNLIAPTPSGQALKNFALQLPPPQLQGPGVQQPPPP
jgi:hypothetical protein